MYGADTLSWTYLPNTDTPGFVHSLESKDHTTHVALNTECFQCVKRWPSATVARRNWVAWEVLRTCIPTMISEISYATFKGDYTVIPAVMWKEMIVSVHEWLQNCENILLSVTFVCHTVHHKVGNHFFTMKSLTDLGPRLEQTPDISIALQEFTSFANKSTPSEGIGTSPA